MQKFATSEAKKSYIFCENLHLIVIHAEPVHRVVQQWQWSIDKDRAGLNLLHRSFIEHWLGKDPVHDLSCQDDSAESVIWEHNILLSGGAVSNTISRHYFNHFKKINYVIEYSMPGYQDVEILDRANGRAVRAVYSADRYRQSKVVEVDFGILTVMRNPMNKGKHIVGCMGIHGYGSFACYAVLSDRALLRDLMNIVGKSRTDEGFQIIVEHDVGARSTRILEDTLFSIQDDDWRAEKHD